MDGQLTYAKELQAAGYTLVQIRDLLLQRGIDQRTVYMLLTSLQTVQSNNASPPQTPVGNVAQDHPETTEVDLSTYVEYVKGLRTQGLSWAAIDTYVASQGVSPSSRAQIYATVQDSEAVHAPEPISPPVQNPLTPTPPVLNATGEKSTDNSEHLAQVFDHLSDVIDELDDELHTIPQVTNDKTSHLSAATEHLAGSVKKLEQDIGQPLPPSSGTSNASAIVATEPPAQQSQPPSTAANDTATNSPKTPAKLNMPILAICAVIFGAVFVQSLLSHERNIIWLGLIGMNVVGTAGFDLLLRGSAWRQVDRWLTATILQTGLFLPFLAKEVVRPIHFPHYTPFDFLLLGCAVTMLITMQFCNVKALQHLEASVFSVVYNVRILFATLLGFIFLSESVGLLSLVGGLLIFVAIFVVRQRSTRGITKQGVLFGLGTALAMSSMNTCEKELIKLVGYEQYIFPMFAIAAIIMWTVVLLRRTEAPFKLLIQPRGLVLMALRACAGIGFSYSLVFGPVAASSYLSSLSVVLIVIFGIVFLNERDYLKSKLIATGTAVVGLTFVLLDSL